MRLSRTRNYLLLKNAVKRMMPGRFAWPGPIDDSTTLARFAVPPLEMSWPAAVAKPRVGLVPDVDVYPYWTKYRRFLQVNAIPFDLYDIHRSDWLTRASEFDIVLWRPMSFPYELEECRRKFWLLERMGKICYPTLAEALIYEDKCLQYELLTSLGLPAVRTFISHSEDEALSWAASAAYPAVWKIACGSGSMGVELVRDRKSAERRIRRVFSHAGRRTYWAYTGQKNYVYVQPLQPNAGYDLRIIVTGEHVLGYYRTAPSGDFRASGMNQWHYAPLPLEAMRLARRVRDELRLTAVAVDMLADPSEEQFSIIEVSVFTQLYMPSQLDIDGAAGTYVFDGDDCHFVSRAVITQDLVLEELLTTRWLRRRGHPQRTPPAALTP